MGGMEIGEFLLARIAEDEAAARESASVLLIIRTERCAVIGSDEHRTYMHFDRHGPARVLAECDAKRQFLAAVQAVPLWPDEASALAVERAILTLALPYADHSDYREEWKP